MTVVNKVKIIKCWFTQHKWLLDSQKQIDNKEPILTYTCQRCGNKSKMFVTYLEATGLNKSNKVE